MANGAVGSDNRRPVVRAARPDDLEAIVSVELEANHDAFESPLDPQTAADVRQKFADRLDLLGSWARVLEIPGKGVVGMNMAYPIGIGIAELTALCDQGLDMQDADVIRDLFDKDGTATWGLDIAVAPSAGMMSGMSFLTADMRSLKAAHGIQRGYFLSRLPGLARWVAEQVPGVNVAELPSERRDALARQYLRTTIRHGGMSRTADPLLAMYVDSGAVPVKLVSHWGTNRPSRGFIDLPSLGYYVLCKHGFGALII